MCTTDPGCTFFSSSITCFSAYLTSPANPPATPGIFSGHRLNDPRTSRGVLEDFKCAKKQIIRGNRSHNLVVLYGFPFRFVYISLCTSMRAKKGMKGDWTFSNVKVATEWERATVIVNPGTALARGVTFVLEYIIGIYFLCFCVYFVYTFILKVEMPFQRAWVKHFDVLVAGWWAIPQ